MGFAVLPKTIPMLISILYALLYLALVIGAIYLILWILGLLGIVIPENIRKVIWAVIIILALIWIVSNLGGFGIHRFR
jgi:hypothetical protein